MTDLFQEPDDAIPLTPAEREGLRQAWITHRRDLNEAEQENIVQGATWARRQRGLTPVGILDDGFARKLHRRMLGEAVADAVDRIEDLGGFHARFQPLRRQPVGFPGAFVGFYTLLLIVELYLMVRFARQGPGSLGTGRYANETAHA